MYTEAGAIGNLTCLECIVAGCVWGSVASNRSINVG